jgi:hypothetical protein
MATFDGCSERYTGMPTAERGLLGESRIRRSVLKKPE